MTLPNNVLKCMEPAERAKLGKAGVTTEEAIARHDAKKESEMQAVIQQYCDLKGWPCYAQRFGKKATGKRGQPDFLVCVPYIWNGTRFGIMVAIETKMPGKKPTPEQTRELELIRRAHGETLVAYSAKQAIDFLNQLARDETI